MLIDEIKELLEKMEDFLLEPSDKLKAELLEEILDIHNEISHGDCHVIFENAPPTDMRTLN